MKPTVIYLVCLILLYAGFSCEEDKDELLNSYEELITGDWIWERSIYYNTSEDSPFVLNPDSLGYMFIHTYLPDGTYTIEKNGIVESKGFYRLDQTTGDNTESSDIILITRENDFQSTAYIILRQDTLIIDKTESDGPERIFVRKPIK